MFRRTNLNLLQTKNQSDPNQNQFEDKLNPKQTLSKANPMAYQASDGELLIVEVQLYKTKFYVKRGGVSTDSPSVRWNKYPSIADAWTAVKLRLDWA